MAVSTFNPNIIQKESIMTYQVYLRVCIIGFQIFFVFSMDFGSHVYKGSKLFSKANFMK